MYAPPPNSRCIQLNPPQHHSPPVRCFSLYDSQGEQKTNPNGYPRHETKKSYREETCLDYDVSSAGASCHIPRLRPTVQTASEAGRTAGQKTINISKHHRDGKNIRSRCHQPGEHISIRFDCLAKRGVVLRQIGITMSGSSMPCARPEALYCLTS